MVTITTIKKMEQVAFDADQDDIRAWIIIGEVNEMLERAGLNARFELSQFIHNKAGKGTLLTGTFDDCEKDKEVSKEEQNEE